MAQTATKSKTPEPNQIYFFFSFILLSDPTRVVDFFKAPEVTDNSDGFFFRAFSLTCSTGSINNPDIIS
jgi:hypothetical protein